MILHTIGSNEISFSTALGEEPLLRFAIVRGSIVQLSAINGVAVLSPTNLRSIEEWIHGARWIIANPPPEKLLNRKAKR
jgi:hypothetical protein